MRITREQAAGLVIDIQDRLLPVMQHKEKLITNCSLFIRGLQALDIPVLVTQQYSKGLGPTVTEISELFPVFSHIEKRDFSCCDEPEVISKLQGINRRFIIICGIESHVCVLQTAVDLNLLGFTPVVVMDATSSRSAESLDLAKERFRHEGIMMTSAESVLFELARSSAAPEFKIISGLVR